MDDLTQFFDALKAGQRDQVEAALAAHPGWVDARSEDGLSAVLTAAYYKEPSLAQLLVDRGADLNLFEACAVGALERAQSILSADPSLVNAFSPDGFQPLGLAVFFGHVRLAETLLSLGAEVNTPSRNRMRVAPLHSALAGRNRPIIDLLLSHGADVNAVQNDEFTPLHAAAQNGDLEIVRRLLELGADPRARLADGRSPRDLAIAGGFTALAELL